MARQPRIQYPGAIYHVIARGDPRERIVLDENDTESTNYAGQFWHGCNRNRKLPSSWNVWPQMPL